MSKNYYQILNIPPQAELKDIANSYRNLSLKWHPQLNKSDINTAYHQFCDIAEAYEVLSDSHKRKIFDQYGEKVLKEGILTEEEGLKGGYKFNGNPEEIFEKFFGSSNPYPQIFEGQTKKEYGSLISNAFGRKDLSSANAIENLVVTIDCTLSELYNGCMKRVNYQRQKLNLDERTTCMVTETKNVEIKKGFSQQEDIVFQGQGHEANGVPTSDLVFKIKELPNPDYKRRNNDLIYFAKIDLVDALSSTPISITTLDQRKLLVPFSSIITPKTVTVIKGEGMPIYNKGEYLVEFFNKPLNKGDLEIHFNIKFPKELSAETKQELKKYLQ